MNKNAFFNMSYGLYIVSSFDNKRPVGCTINAAMQITAEPQTIAISINCMNYTNKCIKDTGKFALCALGEKTNPLTIGTFGFRSSRDFDKFAQTDYVYKNELPVCTCGCAYFTCDVVKTLEAGTHTIFLGKVIDCDLLSNDKPMTYSYYHSVIKGKSPKTAPTYIYQNEL